MHSNNSTESKREQAAAARRKAREDLLQRRLADDHYILSKRPLRILSSIGVETIGQLYGCRRSELAKLAGLGNASLGEIEMFLKSKHLNFRE